MMDAAEKESAKLQDVGCNSRGVRQMWSQASVSSAGSCCDKDFCCTVTVKVQDLCD